MKSYNEQLTALRASGNLRHLPEVEHQGIWILKEGKRMLNLFQRLSWISQPAGFTRGVSSIHTRPLLSLLLIIIPLADG